VRRGWRNASSSVTAQRVLVVDDDVTVSDVVSRYLVRAGFDVSVVTDGRQALAAAAADPPDLVVLDLMLPGMHGLDVFRSLRAAGPVAVIMLTALATEGDRLVGLELGADDYMTKPFSPRSWCCECSRFCAAHLPPWSRRWNRNRPRSRTAISRWTSRLIRSGGPAVR
jgi:CheY-like chemotaxis protein